MAVLMIRLIYLAESTFVFSNKANILDSALTNHFLSLTPLKSLSNSSCTESDNWLKYTINPYYYLLKNATFSIKKSNDLVTSHIIK